MSQTETYEDSMAVAIFRLYCTSPLVELYKIIGKYKW